MLGSAIVKYLGQYPALHITAAARSTAKLHILRKYADEVAIITNVLDAAEIDKILRSTQPTVVINCIGIVKQSEQAQVPTNVIQINALLPHILKESCSVNRARLIHISTDCVFSGKKGMYTEDDVPDAEDMYGRTKLLGEVIGDNVITMRTSIIGREIDSKLGLVEWFLNQHDAIRGYERAIFSGVTTIELARIIGSYVIPNRALNGLYHIASHSISKFDLLTILSQVYGHHIPIDRDNGFIIDRSLSAEKFNRETGYRPLAWHKLVEQMFNFN